MATTPRPRQYQYIPRNPYLVEQIHTMQDQEIRYKLSVADDYMNKSSSLHRYFPNGDIITTDDRKAMCKWSYTIVDGCKLSRQVAVVAIQYFDRFLCTAATLDDSLFDGRRLLSSRRATIALVSRREFQLAFISCLVIALKNHSGMIVESEFVSDILCQSMYCTQELSEMEMEVLRALDWRLNGPSPHDFFHRFLEFLPSKHENVVEAVRQLCETEAELAMLDYSMAVRAAPSTIAFTSMLCSLQSYGAISSSEKARFLDTIEVVTGMTVNDVGIRALRRGKVIKELDSVGTFYTQTYHRNNSSQSPSFYRQMMPSNSTSPVSTVW
jgi:hypothetical protein|eukprot:scaffold4011_cov115-Alexandrium_tamarense.AAC.5